MADAETNARRRKEQLVADITRLGEELSARRAELTRVERFLADYALYAEGDSIPVEPKHQPRRVLARLGMTFEDNADLQAGVTIRYNNPPRALIGQTAREIIEKAGRPVSRDALFEGLKERGLIVRGKDPMMVLSTMMWRMQDEFVRLPGYGYWLRELPCAAASYEPTQGVVSDERPADDEN